MSMAVVQASYTGNVYVTYYTIWISKSDNTWQLINDNLKGKKKKRNLFRWGIMATYNW